MSIFYTSNAWNRKKIKWRIIYQNLFKLQDRVVKQIERKKFRQARHLQRLILKSFCSRLIVSQKILEIQNFEQFNLYKNSDKDHFLHQLPINDYLQLESSLYNSFNVYTQKHLVYTQFLCLLWTLALLPISETVANPFFYNNRLYRDHTDILEELCQVLKNNNFKWVLIIKPTHFFNNKHQKWLIKNVLIEKKFLIYILKLEKLASFSRKYYKYNRGIKKISLIKLFKNFSFYEEFDIIFKKSNYLYNHLYYNDLIIVLSSNLNTLKKFYRLFFFLLRARGLSIKKNRVWLIKIADGEGFNFLGWSLKQTKNQVLINISRSNIHSHQLEIKKFLKFTRFLPIDQVVKKLNKKIIRWQKHYAYSSNIYKVWSEMNYYLFWRIWRWCKKRHKNKGSKWLYLRYWDYKKDRKWVFHFNNCYLKSYSVNRQTITHLSASLNACKIENLKLIKNILFYKNQLNKYNIY